MEASIVILKITWVPIKILPSFLKYNGKDVRAEGWHEYIGFGCRHRGRS